MDLTPTLSDLLVKSHSPPISPPSTTHLTQTLDAFLKEAYQINTSLNSLLKYLQSIRQPYLSNAPAPRRQHHAPQRRPQTPTFPSSATPTHLTDTQRTTIDSETSSLLRSLNTSITNLSSAADLQHDTATKLLHKKYGRPTSLLFRWAAGSDSPDPDAGKTAQQIDEEGRTRTIKEFRDAVLWYLRMKLQEAAARQGGMVDTRVERERQKQMSSLSDARNKGLRSSISVPNALPESDSNRFHDYNTSNTGGGGQRNGSFAPDDYGTIDLRGHDSYNPSLDPNPNLNPSSAANAPPQLTEEQLQLFSEENSLLFTHFSTSLSKITLAEKSLLEISSLQQTLLGHLSVQAEQIGNLVGDAEDTGQNLQRGNRELKRASERGSTARGVFWGTVGVCGFLVVWDLIF